MIFVRSVIIMSLLLFFSMLFFACSPEESSLCSADRD